MPDRKIVALAGLFRILADPHRLRILQLLAARGEQTVTALCSELHQSQPAVSHHLGQLKTTGLITYRRDGKYNHYRLDTAGVAELLRLWAGDAPAVRVQAAGVEIGVRLRRGD